MLLSVIIPNYNEEKSILEVIDKLDELALPDFISGKELIIVDDASTDHSVDIITRHIEKLTHCHLLVHEVNRGKGASVHTALKKCKGEVILIQDADLELSTADIPRMLKAMHHLDIEFVNGSRYLPGIDRPLHSYKRYLVNRFFTFMTSLLINVKLTDMACGYKLVKRSLYDKISLKEKRFGFEAELIIKALRVKRNNIAEIPVQYFPRNEGEGKKFRNTDAVRILWVIIKYGLFRRN